MLPAWGASGLTDWDPLPADPPVRDRPRPAEPVAYQPGLIDWSWWDRRADGSLPSPRDGADPLPPASRPGRAGGVPPLAGRPAPPHSTPGPRPAAPGTDRDSLPGEPASRSAPGSPAGRPPAPGSSLDGRLAGPDIGIDGRPAGPGSPAGRPPAPGSGLDGRPAGPAGPAGRPAVPGGLDDRPAAPGGGLDGRPVGPGGRPVAGGAASPGGGPEARPAGSAGPAAGGAGSRAGAADPAGAPETGPGGLRLTRRVPGAQLPGPGADAEDAGWADPGHDPVAAAEEARAMLEEFRSGSARALAADPPAGGDR